MELINHPDRDAVAASTRGQILDSVVDVEGIPFGVSAALFKNPFARRFTQNCLEKLLSMNEKRMEIYLASSRIFKVDLTFRTCNHYSVNPPACRAEHLFSPRVIYGNYYYY